MPVDGAPTQIERRRRRTDSPSERAVHTENPEAPVIPLFDSNPEDDAAVEVPVVEVGIESILVGMEAAIDVADVAMLVADRETGSVLWCSDSWLARFGKRDTLSRYVPSAIELGESAWPVAGSRWNRTTSMRNADESVELCNIAMVGLGGPGGSELITLVAIDKASEGPIITDRAEVVTVIDGSIAATGSGTVGVLYIDLDRFQAIEERIGSVDAAILLDQVSRKLGGTVRGTDLLFRLESDEFVIVAAELDHERAAEELAEKVRGSFATIDGFPQDLAITASIGVAVARNGQSGGATLRSAELALLEAKTKGRNRVAVHDSEARSRAERQNQAERQLRDALERGQIQFNYQPVVQMSTGRVVGAEALLRFGGQVSLSAAEVVAAAEQGGLMGTLGRTVLDGVEAELGDWLRSPDLEHVIMINLSASQIEDPELLDRLKAVANEGYPDRRLALEVPEVVVRSNRSAYLALSRSLAGNFLMGIDGFGTNESSVEMLTGLPLDYIKLHRSVTAGIVGDNNNEMSGLKALLSRAEESRIMVVALGVESRSQAERLQAVDCPLGQGFLYASAVTADKLMDLSTIGFTPAKAGN